MSNIDSRPSYSNAREYAILAAARYYEEFKNRKRGTVDEFLWNNLSWIKNDNCSRLDRISRRNTSMLLATS